MEKESIEKLKNNDIWWLWLSHLIAFAGPVGFVFLFVVWCVVIYRHQGRQKILESF